MACRPIGKKIALVQCAASAASTFGVLRPGAVVEGQHDLAFAQKIMALEVLEAEARPAGGINLNNSRHSEGARIIGARSCRNL